MERAAAVNAGYMAKVDAKGVRSAEKVEKESRSDPRSFPAGT